MPQVRLISGGIHRDSRGEVRHVNRFDFARVDRFYVVTPARPGEVRGWVGHRRDWKWFFVIKGVVEIAVVEPDSWATPSRTCPIQTFRLDAESPAVLEVPAGFYTASRARTDGAILEIFSSGTIETAGEDDYRLPADHWTFPA